MMEWVIFFYVGLAAIGSLWAWHLHTKGELVGDYPYDDEM